MVMKIKEFNLFIIFKINQKPENASHTHFDRLAVVH